MIILPVLSMFKMVKTQGDVIVEPITLSAHPDVKKDLQEEVLYIKTVEETVSFFVLVL